MTVVIGMCNNKGGAGKTTLTVLTAWQFARQGFKTLVIDGDPQGNCSETLVSRTTLRRLREESNQGNQEDGKQPVTFSYQLYNEELTHDFNAYKKGLNGVSIVPAMINDPKLSMIEGVGWDQITNPRNHITSMAQKGEYDIVLIDTPPVRGRLQIGWIHACDYIVMPLQLSPYAMSGPEGLSETLTDLEEMAGYAPRLLGVVANNYDRRAPEEVDKVEEYRELLGDMMFNAELPHRTPITASIAKRTPLWQTKSGSARRANKLVKTLVDEIMERAGVAHV